MFIEGMEARGQADINYRQVLADEYGPCCVEIYAVIHWVNMILDAEQPAVRSQLGVVEVVRQQYFFVVVLLYFVFKSGITQELRRR